MAEEKDTPVEDEKTPEVLAAEVKAKEEEDSVARGDSVDDVKDETTDDKGTTDSADDGAADEEAPKKSTMVPKGRLDTKNRMLDDANKTIKALEDKLATSGVDATAGTDKPDTFDSKIETAEAAFLAARKDGDADAEVKAMREIRALERDQRVADNAVVKTTAVSEAGEEAKFNSVMDVIEDAHPELNPNNYDPDDPKSLYSQDVVDEVVDLQHAFMLRGHTKSEAVIRAVGYVFPSAGGADGGDEVAQARDKKKSERDAAALKKNLDAAGKAAPDTKGVGQEGTSAGATDTMPDAGKLSEEEFDALPEAMKQRMRGDEVG